MRKALLLAMMLFSMLVGRLGIPPGAFCQSCNCEANPLKQVTHMKNLSTDPPEGQKDMFLVELDWSFGCKGLLELSDVGYLPCKGSLTYLSDKSEARFLCVPTEKGRPVVLCDCNLRPKPTEATPPEVIEVAPEWVPWHRGGTENIKSPTVGQFKLLLLQALQKHGFYVNSFKDERYLIWRTAFRDVGPEGSPLRTQLALKFVIYDEGACGKAEGHTSWFLIYYCFREKRPKEDNWNYHSQWQLSAAGLKSAQIKFREVIGGIKQRLVGKE